MLCFVSRKNNSVTVGLNFLLVFMAIISNTVNTLFSVLNYSLLNFNSIIRREYPAPPPLLKNL